MVRAACGLLTYQDAHWWPFSKHLLCTKDCEVLCLYYCSILTLTLKIVLYFSRRWCLIEINNGSTLRERETVEFSVLNEISISHPSSQCSGMNEEEEWKDWKSQRLWKTAVQLCSDSKHKTRARSGLTNPSTELGDSHEALPQPTIVN